MVAPRNLIAICDGTSNDIQGDRSTNALKTFRVAARSRSQLVFYNPGPGTLNLVNPWDATRQKLNQIFQQATGAGIEQQILSLYGMLAHNYRPGDQIFLFGFSRGSYVVRAVAGMIHTVGLVEPINSNLAPDALKAYQAAEATNTFEEAQRFKVNVQTRRVPIHFIGAFDTVNSVIIPRMGKFLGFADIQTLPYTLHNPSVEVFRHAMAIDERRAMFRSLGWAPNQIYKPDRFAKWERDQDSKQVWFVGDHSDVGGGYPEKESALAKLPLQWMLTEAQQHGFKIDEKRYNHLVLGADYPGSKRDYVAPNAFGTLHDSMGSFWPAVELLPKSIKDREDPDAHALLDFTGLYLPLGERRFIPENALIHKSVKERMDGGISYNPPLPKNPQWVG